MLCALAIRQLHFHWYQILQVMPSIIGRSTPLHPLLPYVQAHIHQ